MAFLRISFLVLAAAAVALGVIFILRPKPFSDKWHEGPIWNRLLSLYNESIENSYLAQCEQRMLKTSFGSTFAFVCGKESSLPPVVLLHGAASSALIYRKWLLPTLSSKTQTIAVDFPCDVGRSIPPDGDVAKCPQTQRELAQWVSEFLDQLNIARPVSLIGYSYGAFTAASFALIEPQRASRLVTIAPACIFAPIENGWLLRAIAYAFIPGRWFFDYMAADKQRPYLDTLSEFDKKYVDANSAVRVTTLAVSPYAFSDAELAQLAKQTATLLVIGDKETVTNHEVAVETAKRSNVRVELLPNTGHLLLVEHARLRAEEIVVEFLTTE